MQTSIEKQLKLLREWKDTYVLSEEDQIILNDIANTIASAKMFKETNDALTIERNKLKEENLLMKTVLITTANAFRNAPSDWLMTKEVMLASIEIQKLL